MIFEAIRFSWDEEMTENDLIEEWKKADPFLLDLEGFQKFCDIRITGNKYPLDYEDVFWTIEPIKAPFPGCSRELIGTAVGTCTPHESSDDYWKRNNIAAATLRAVVALHTKKNDENWPLHLNDSERHLKWIEDEFGFAVEEKDFDEAWSLWEHTYWFSEDGYYVKGWMAVADALGIGSIARSVLEKTPFPHADSPDTIHEKICSKRDICPIYQYREWLKTTEIKDIPDKVFRHPTFRGNLNYYLNISPVDNDVKKHETLERINSPRLDFRTKWHVHNQIREYSQLPLCKKCGELSYWHWRLGCDSDLEEREKYTGLELCYNCIGIIEKTYTTRINPLKTENATWSIPEGEEKELRRRLIEGDVIFDGVSN